MEVWMNFYNGRESRHISTFMSRSEIRKEYEQFRQKVCLTRMQDLRDGTDFNRLFYLQMMSMHLQYTY